ncbi:MAG: tRNA-binding protein [Bdellovibrionales bacterium]|nr:tRNA-binding protein [Bdellovibrionales bacterium]
MVDLSWEEFERVELRVGTIVRAEDFPEARNPAFKVWVDFGELGIKKSSAQICTHYTKDELIGKQILGVLNFPPKQIGPFRSEFLVTGVPDADGGIVLVEPNLPAPNGARLR